MYLAEVTFTAKGRVTEDVVNHVAMLRHEWSISGQTLSTENRLAQRGRDVVLQLQLPERGSLAAKFALKRTRDMLQSLRDLGVQGPKVRIVGRVPDTEEVDRCRSRALYILFTHAFSAASPIRCGKCLGPVPLYRLPSEVGSDLDYMGKSWRSRTTSAASIANGSPAVSGSDLRIGSCRIRRVNSTEPDEKPASCLRGAFASPCTTFNGAASFWETS